MRATLAFLVLFGAGTVAAHPMGNFSVSHYSRLDVSPAGCRVTYVLDLAEIPAFELLQQWKVLDAPPALIKQKANAKAREWIANLEIAYNGSPVSPRIHRIWSEVYEGAGGMQVLRVTAELEIPVSPGTLRYADRNYPGRAGWKEIVIAAASGATISTASHSDRDLTGGLSVYPADPSVSPPQDVEAVVTWSAPAMPAPAAPRAKKPEAAPLQAPAAKLELPAPKTFSTQQPPASGTLQSGDTLSRLLRREELSLQLMAIGIAIAFGLGMMHALAPGHGKTIVAAYLVGSRGTLKHALFLGSTVTFTHTVSVFLLGLGVLFFQEYAVPERVIPVLGAISGASIIVVGSTLFFRRLRALAAGGAPSHEHPHYNFDHSHEARQIESELRFLPEEYSHEQNLGGGFTHTHSHGGQAHSHWVPDQRISLGSLVALGVSGGLVPCPSALILMLSAIALGRTAFGLLLLVAFSLGLAIVLMGIGATVLYARKLLPDASSLHSRPLFKLVPVLSAVVVIILGMLMTMTSLGWIRPGRILG